MEVELGQLKLIDEIEQDNPGGKRNEEDRCNIIGEVLREIMKERSLSVTEVVYGSKAPFATMDDWINGRKVPLAGKNLLNLYNFLNVPLEYLCFGIGDKNANVKYDLLLNFFEFCLEEVKNENELSYKKIKIKMEDTFRNFENAEGCFDDESGSSMGGCGSGRTNSRIHGR